MKILFILWGKRSQKPEENLKGWILTPLFELDFQVHLARSKLL